MSNASDLHRSSWWHAEKGEVCRTIVEYVSEVERQQSYLFERFYKLACLYDPYFEFLSGYGSWYETRHSDADVTENIVASGVDTVTAIAASSEVRARIMTDDGDFSTQRRARHLEWYAEGISKILNLHELGVAAFKESCIKGTGLIKVFLDPFTGQPNAELVLVDDVIVDEAECRNGRPRQMHQRRFVDRDDLIDAFSEHEDAINMAQTGTSGLNYDWRYWADYRPVRSNQLVVIESWRLPMGKQPGRHTIVIDGADLVDEEWTKEFFPFARMVWAERRPGWYGVGGAERIAGHQRRLNKMNWQEDRIRDRFANPTTWVSQVDSHIAVSSRSQLGNIAVFKSGRPPQTIFPPAANPDQVERRREIKGSGYEEIGVSQLAATAQKPAGLESGAALREYRDSTTQRFNLQEKAREKMHLDAVWLALDVCKDLGADAPVIIRKTPSGKRRIEWKRVDMTEVRTQIAAASNVSRTPAGRIQQVLEFAQAGIISQDEARRLLRHPDLARAMSLYTAAIENIEAVIEEMLDGKRSFPEPYQNLQIGIWRVQMAYLKARNDGAPEELLENLRQWMVQAAFVLNPPQPQAVAPEAQTSDPMAQPMPGGMPTEAPPQAAFADQAMTSVA